MSSYQEQYRKKLTTPEKAVADIKDGATIVPGMVNGEPYALLSAIADRARQGDLKDINIYFLHPAEGAAMTVLAPDLCDCIQVYTWFVGLADRARVRVGLNYFVPNYFHQIPRLIKDFMQVDVAVAAVSPMDKAGYFTAPPTITPPPPPETANSSSWKSTSTCPASSEIPCCTSPRWTP
jgi:itaconate CoA-transferase